MHNVRHHAADSRFTLELDGNNAELDYELDQQIMIITHTRVPVAFRGRGVAADLMEAALSYARAQGLTVKPLCSYAAAYLQRQAALADQRQLHREALLDEALDESFPASDSPAVGGAD